MWQLLFNRRIRKHYETSNEEWAYKVNDAYSKLFKNYNRGRVPVQIMNEIGYENCDYVSFEHGWGAWHSTFKNWHEPIELHLPCRDPVDHFMSWCNYKGHKFDCNGSIEEQLQKCHVYEVNERFSKKLASQMTVKCFDFKKSFNDYIEYMGQFLQERRNPVDYFHRPTNKKRNKKEECIWKDPKLMDDVSNILKRKYDYFKFCDECLGSMNDLLIG
jgi:hypothetical protein